MSLSLNPLFLVMSVVTLVKPFAKTNWMHF